MIKIYSVELETKHAEGQDIEPLIEPFWMYRGFGKNLEEAEKCAELLSTFYPYDEYPTTIVLYSEDEQEDGNLINKTVIKTFKLANEDGQTVVLQ